ncbi:hypothetical protein NDU88_006408 [Pleurodeles waltl]|uniref:Uncharacterized protein n=1 Tax=Pleurodeles waltl TaxID=8319 RepID=A0AAV7LUT4_PLEWA|nr:hypothetical protein NDU88_006408 [Pleurodeles waltl]
MTGQDNGLCSQREELVDTFDLTRQNANRLTGSALEATSRTAHPYRCQQQGHLFEEVVEATKRSAKVNKKITTNTEIKDKKALMLAKRDVVYCLMHTPFVSAEEENSQEGRAAPQIVPVVTTRWFPLSMK